jgi:phospholipid/cholesterol/gamma-HCH transport system substrate-binding protein
MNRRVLINLVFFNVVFGVMILWAVNNIVTLDAIERPYTISGDFEQAAGVRDDAEVTYLGVHYGFVSGVERTDGGVRITMQIDRGKDIPAGAIARVFRKSAIGEPYIDLNPPPDFDPNSDARIEPGDNVPIERTTVPLEFSELLRSASALISSIDPEAAGGLIHELSVGLAGRGPALRDMTASFDTLTAAFADRTDQLDRLAENNTRITRVLADHRLSVGQSITNLRAVAESLRNAKGDLEQLLAVGPDFLRTTADLVAEEKQALDCILTDLAPLLTTAATGSRIESLETLLELGPTAFGYVFSAIDREPDGPWIRVNLLVPIDGEPPAVYAPRATLPVVPTISPCASTLVPAAVFGEGAATTAASARRLPVAPGAAPARSSAPVARGALDEGRLPTTGAEPLAILALVLVAGALAGWHVQRPRGDRR